MSNDDGILVNADGSVLHTDFDTENAQPWNFTRTSYNADNAPTNITREYDNGRIESTTYVPITGAIASVAITTPKSFATTETVVSEPTGAFNRDGTPVMRVVRIETKTTNDDGSSTTVSRYGDGSTRTVVLNDDGSQFSNVLTTAPPSGIQTLFTSTNLQNASDAVGFFTAVRGGTGYAAGTSFFTNLANITGDVSLGGIASAGNAVISLLSLGDALEKSNVAGAALAGANALKYGAQAYAGFLGLQIDNITNFVGPLTEQAAAETALEINKLWVQQLEAQAFAQTIGDAIPYLNLVNAFANGDTFSQATAIIALMPGIGPQLALALNIARAVLDIFLENDPEPWGKSRFIWDESAVGVTGIGAGAIRIHTESNDGGDLYSEGVAESALTYLQTAVALANAETALLNPGNTSQMLGLIANRLPEVQYGLSQTPFRLVDVHPVTGADATRYYDVNGRPLPQPTETIRVWQDGQWVEQRSGAVPNRLDITNQLIQSANARRAIAPIWEVQTAFLQTRNGVNQAGLTEVQRAGQIGQLAQPMPAGTTTQTFRPVQLDLEGNGFNPIPKSATGPVFDVDDTNFLKHTAWVGTNGDAIQRCNTVKRQDGQGSSRHVCRRGRRGGGFGGFGLRGRAWVVDKQGRIALRTVTDTGLQ